MLKNRQRLLADTLYFDANPREKHYLPRLIIRSSDIHAAGCFALENIPKGTRILEYNRRAHQQGLKGTTATEAGRSRICLALGDGEVVIDGHGMAMFVNHSCDPNCETDEEKDRVFIFSIRDIAAGEELTYDYWLYDGDDDAPCYCGSKSCRGTMYSPEEVKPKGPRGSSQKAAGGAGSEEERRVSQERRQSKRCWQEALTCPQTRAAVASVKIV